MSTEKSEVSGGIFDEILGGISAHAESMEEASSQNQDGHFGGTDEHGEAIVPSTVEGLSMSVNLLKNQLNHMNKENLILTSLLDRIDSNYGDTIKFLRGSHDQLLKSVEELQANSTEQTKSMAEQTKTMADQSEALNDAMLAMYGLFSTSTKAVEALEEYSKTTGDAISKFIEDQKFKTSNPSSFTNSNDPTETIIAAMDWRVDEILTSVLHAKNMAEYARKDIAESKKILDKLSKATDISYHYDATLDRNSPDYDPAVVRLTKSR